MTKDHQIALHQRSPGGRGFRPSRAGVLHGQVLDHDDIMVADEPGGGAVQEVGPRRADLAVGAGDLGPGLGSVGGPLLAAGQAPLAAGQAAFPPGQVARVRDLVPVAGDGEVLDAQVHPDQGAGGGKRRGVGHVDGEGDVPAAAWVLRDRHRGRVERRRVDVGPRPGVRQRRARLGEVQLPVAVPEPGAGVLGALPPAAGLVPRVAGAGGRRSRRTRPAGGGAPAAAERRTPHAASRAPRWPSSRSGRRWPGRGSCWPAHRGSGLGARPGCGSRPRGRSRTCGSVRLLVR